MRRATSAIMAALLVWASVAGAAASAAVTPHGLFTDNMVLQQQRKVPVWGTARDGEAVTVEIQGQRASTTAKGGKWQVWLAPMKAGGPFTMTIRGENTVTLKNVLVGEVWVCSGQSNMAMAVSRCADAEAVIAGSKNPKLRLFTVKNVTSDRPLSAVPVGRSWVEAGPKTVGNFSGVGYFFGQALQKALKVPVGLIHSSWGGSPADAWTSREALLADPALKGIVQAREQYVKTRMAADQEKYLAKMKKWPEIVKQARAAGKRPPRKPVDPAKTHRRPCCLYNGMIHPLLPYALRGAIWYQGEANAKRAYQYRTLMPAMIQCWRRVWGQGDFPFLMVQLAPFVGKLKGPTWPELREAQLLTTHKLPNVGMAVITDVGDRMDIHPKRKGPVGERLALAARKIAYGEDIVYSGPEYCGMKVEGKQVVLSFKHVGSGLMTKGGEVKGFTIAGKDRRFVPARAEIRGDKVVVSHPSVGEPVAVRFGWENFPVCDLWNKEELPATPFRTDDFPMITR